MNSEARRSSNLQRWVKARAFYIPTGLFEYRPTMMMMTTFDVNTNTSSKYGIEICLSPCG